MRCLFSLIIILFVCSCSGHKNKISLGQNSADTDYLNSFIKDLTIRHKAGSSAFLGRVYVKFGTLGRITELGLVDGQLDSIPTSINKMVFIEHLTIENCGLNSLDNIRLPRLQNLLLKKNSISRVNFMKCISDSLMFVDLSSNKIQGNVDFSTFPNAINYINISNNLLTSVDLSQENEKLNFVDLSNNDIYSTNNLLCRGHGLSRVNLYDNKIKYVNVKCKDTRVAFDAD